MDEASWGLPGALVTPEIPEADSYCATPLSMLLETAAARDPDAIALASLTRSLSYADLLRLARNAACAVAERVPPGEAVACVLPRQPENIAALLGCLMTDRPCLIVEANDPAERRNALLAAAAPSLLLTLEPTPSPCPVLTLDAALAAHDRAWLPDLAWDPDAPFAVHFTSGSDPDSQRGSCCRHGRCCIAVCKRRKSSRRRRRQGSHIPTFPPRAPDCPLCLGYSRAAAASCSSISRATGRVPRSACWNARR